MPRFRCTNCGRRIDSPVLIGAGDCPRCGGDVVFDLHGERDPDTPLPPTRRWWQRLLRRRGR